MNEQKNLFLAIGISIAIIVLFQLIFPAQTIDKSKTSNVDIIEPATLEAGRC